MTLEEWLGYNNELGKSIWINKYQKNNETLKKIIILNS